MAISKIGSGGRPGLFATDFRDPGSSALSIRSRDRWIPCAAVILGGTDVEH